MGVDLAAFGVFIDIAFVISLIVWTNHRTAMEKEQRLDKARRRPS